MIQKIMRKSNKEVCEKINARVSACSSVSGVQDLDGGFWEAGEAETRTAADNTTAENALDVS